MSRIGFAIKKCMNKKNSHYQVIIIGAGAAGLMAAAQAGKRGRKTLLLEHTNKIGEKIRISGGGRCNFTNLHASPGNYICKNPHFMKSALAGYTQHDFIKLVESYKIAYHEKTLGQLFCDGSSKQIINMMIDLCTVPNVEIKLNCAIADISKNDSFEIQTNQGTLTADSLVIACGGLSIPQIGASDFGYRIAKKFGLKIVSTRPALVPLVINQSERPLFTSLSGISNLSIVQHKKIKFLENILFTHKGLSGPAILQISSYLEQFNGTEIILNLIPHTDLRNKFIEDKNSKQSVASYLKTWLPNRLIEALSYGPDFHKSITDLKKESLYAIADKLQEFKVKIEGSEGYQKAEVTVGGIDTDFLSSKTMAAHMLPNLFFIGEVVDVTGWLGGYNFQWAWSSGFAAGNNC